MEPDRRAAEEAFAAGRFLDFVKAVGGAEDGENHAFIGELIPAVDLESVDLGQEPTAKALFELAALVWEVDERLALSMFREAAVGGSTEALAALGENLQWMGHDEEAVVWLRKAIDAGAGNSLRLAGLLGEVLMRTGGPAYRDEAESLLTMGLQESTEFGVPLAQLLLERGSADDARELLERAVATDVYGAALLLGNLLAEMPGAFDAAEAAYRAGIASGDAHSAHNLAVMLRDNGEVARAAEFHELANRMGDLTPLQAPSD